MMRSWSEKLILSPFSLSTFIKHLQASKPKTVSFHHAIKNRRFVRTEAAHLPHFESLTDQQKDQISLYVDTLLQWNQKMNLTAATEKSEVMDRHIEDSLAIIPPIRDSYASHCGCSYSTLNLVDVGSGQGLPGLILAIACPGWEVTLVESMNKRCLFLDHVVSLMSLPNVQVVRGRAESLGQNPDFREIFDVAVARAVAELRILAEYCLPLVRVGGLFVAAKGHDPQWVAQQKEPCKWIGVIDEKLTSQQEKEASLNRRKSDMQRKQFSCLVLLFCSCAQWNHTVHMGIELQLCV